MQEQGSWDFLYSRSKLLKGSFRGNYNFHENFLFFRDDPGKTIPWVTKNPCSLEEILCQENIDALGMLRESFRGKSWIPPVSLGPEKQLFQFLLAPGEEKDSVDFISLPLNQEIINRLAEGMGYYEILYYHSEEIFMKVTTGGILAEMNPQGLAKLGLSENDLGRLNISQLLLNPPDYPQLLKRFEQKDSLNELEICLKSPDQDKVGLTFIYALRDKEGKLTALCFYIRDISNRVNLMSDYMRTSLELTMAYEDLKKAQTTLVNQEKMASVGLLAAGLAHEINNPLGYISNNIHVLKDYFHSLFSYQEALEEGLNSTTKEQINLDQLRKKWEIPYIREDFPELSREMTEGVVRIEKLLNSLRFFSQKDSKEKFGYYNLNQALESLLDLTYNEYKYSATIERKLGNIPQIYCHMMSLNQALFQLFMNAVQAIKKYRKGDTGNILLETYHRNDWVHLIIADDGGGIPEKVMERINEPFFTTKDSEKGTGLGMTIANEIIVNNHGGAMTIENISGGVRIHIELPIVEESKGENP